MVDLKDKTEWMKVLYVVIAIVVLVDTMFFAMGLGDGRVVMAMLLLVGFIVLVSLTLGLLLTFLDEVNLKKPVHIVVGVCTILGGMITCLALAISGTNNDVRVGLHTFSGIAGSAHSILAIVVPALAILQLTGLRRKTTVPVPNNKNEVRMQSETT